MPKHEIDLDQALIKKITAQAKQKAKRVRRSSAYCPLCRERRSVDKLASSRFKRPWLRCTRCGHLWQTVK